MINKFIRKLVFSRIRNYARMFYHNLFGKNLLFSKTLAKTPWQSKILDRYSKIIRTGNTRNENNLNKK